MTRKRTLDRARFYTPERLGKKRSITPEGFLVCHDVPIARTGTQLYTAEEIPIDPGPDGLVRIERMPEEVFRDETAASFEGKAVTVEHPNDFVTPDNWKALSVGTVQNVRRGDGIDDDLLIADLVITDPGAIDYVNKDLPEVSAGYEAEYEQVEPGRGLQREIVGNHVALVERGRAGPRCSIQDKEPEDMTTKTKDKSSLLARLMKAIKIGDADEIKQTMADAEEEETPEDKAKREAAEKEKKTTDSIASLTATVDALAKTVAKLTADADGDDDEDDEKKKTDDEDGDDEDEEGKEKTADDILEAEKAGKADTGVTYTGDTLKQIVSRAEILAPGIAIQTTDGKVTKDAAIKLQLKALETARATNDGKEAVETFLMGRDLKKLTADELAGVFAGAAELTRHKNNAKGSRSGVSTNDFGKALTVSDINARNREFWAAKAR